MFLKPDAVSMNKINVVVPTGFEPVFKDDYDFALYFCEL